MKWCLNSCHFTWPGAVLKLVSSEPSNLVSPSPSRNSPGSSSCLFKGKDCLQCGSGSTSPSMDKLQFKANTALPRQMMIEWCFSAMLQLFTFGNDDLASLELWKKNWNVSLGWAKKWANAPRYRPRQLLLPRICSIQIRKEDQKKAN